MSTATLDDVRCTRCATVNPCADMYCGGCGNRLHEQARSMDQRTHPGYRGPRRMLVGGGLLFFVAGLAAVAALIAMKASAGVSGFWIELGVPLANSLLDAAGVNLKAPEQHGASGLIVATFILSFVVAASSLTSMGFGSVWLLVRLARDRRVSDRGRDIADVADTAVDAGRRHAVAALDRGSQEYAELKPKISRAARRGRETFNDDVQPRVAAGVAKAATHGRVLIARRRAWAEQRSRRR